MSRRVNSAMDSVLVDVFVRWLHVAGVVVWMGHNWHNVVTTPRYLGVLPSDPSENIKDVFVSASKREHGIFRYASLVVLTTGIVMLWRRDVLAEIDRKIGIENIPPELRVKPVMAEYLK